MLKLFKYTAWTILIFMPLLSQAEAPDLKSASPVIYLADNLDEKDNLGWCIDTQGRGFAETLHAHSCKPAGQEASDTQFAYNADTGQIQSVLFEGKCMTQNTPDADVAFGLLDCESEDPSQKFVYEDESMEIHISSDRSQCVAVGANSAAAGPYMSRGLLSASCDSIENKFKQWVIK